ncbi:MAG TPA: type II toxin-antitoxin system Phd/YefM family antitoxin [bacterium]|nr:type II toxin-antitoxin system Phd/YefM family antitoxin [bacterium]
MEKTVSKSRFKSHALEYFRQVEQSGEPLIVTDHGRPVIKVTSYRPDADELLRALRGSVIAYREPTEPVDAEEWETLK